ncbi:MATE family efflux transporter [Parachlamydia sp. AcF125]|uniref:MATE family efflux transporter n=1 Tax=Parachlamydia sp. AcF125 TaxID=2795736 RepID=UPI001BC9569A|nr:MATE family efflux transporter [Parachlamydia sp. AcF125]MBS4167729.1 Multidrug export protein MepA [Parachlamydia sp. AcF125]
MDLTKGEVPSLVRKIAIPAALGFFFNTMFNVVDTYFAGWVSTQALAALSLSFPVFFIILAFVQGLSTGSAALISNALGSKNEVQAERVSAQVLSFAVICYFFLLVIGLSIDSTLFRLMGAEGEYLEMAVAYMDIIFIGSFFFIVLYAANSILLARGNTTVLRNYLVLGSFINAVLDPWFLYGGYGVPAMGLKGIAVATVATMLIGFFYVLFEVIRSGYLRICCWKDFIPKREIFYAITEQSFPAALNMMTIGMGIFIMTYFIKDFGQEAVAAYGIGIRIEQITLLPTIGLTVASLSIVGQNNGAGFFDRIKETLNVSVKYGAMIIVVGCLLMSLFPQYLYKIFSEDQKVIEIGSAYLRIAALMSAAYMLLGINISALQGMKKPFFPFFMGCLRQIILPCLIYYLMTQVLHLGLLSLWWSSFTITWIGAFITLFYTRWVIKQKASF